MDKTSNGVKIFYIANARMPTEKAHGIQLAKMCEAFLKAGAELELILPARHNSIAESLEEFYGLRQKIAVKKLPVLPLGFYISGITFAFSYFFYFIFKKPEGIVYTTDLDQFSFFLIPFLPNPYFAEIHDAKPRGFLFELLFKRAKGIIVINQLIKEKLCERFGLAPHKVIVHPNGIDLEMFSQKLPKEEARKKLNLPFDKKIALYVGRETWWKGMEILSEAQKFLPPETIQVVRDRPYLEIPFWMRAADVCLVLGTKKHEYSYYHTSPMKLFEYMASGRPIVAADTPANRQIISENEAIFYEPDNARDLAEKIKYAFDAKLDDKIKAALEKVKNFSWDKRAKSILEFMKI